MDKNDWLETDLNDFDEDIGLDYQEERPIMNKTVVSAFVAAVIIAVAAFVYQSAVNSGPQGIRDVSCCDCSSGERVR